MRYAYEVYTEIHGGITRMEGVECRESGRQKGGTGMRKRMGKEEGFEL